MRIAGIYSFKNGREIIATDFAIELQEIEQVVAAVDGAKHKTKVSKEKTIEVGRITKFRAIIRRSSILQITKGPQHFVALFGKWISLKIELVWKYNSASMLLWSTMFALR